SYQLSYLDNAVVGEYWPTYVPPTPLEGDLVDHLNLIVTMGTDDKECQTPVHVILASNTTQQLFDRIVAGPGNVAGNTNPCNRQSGACTGVNSTSDYWNNAGSGQGAITCKISFPNPIPLWQIENAQLTVTGVGDSWHGGFAVTFDLPQTGANPAGAYYAF